MYIQIYATCMIEIRVGIGVAESQLKVVGIEVAQFGTGKVRGIKFWKDRVRVTIYITDFATLQISSNQI